MPLETAKTVSKKQVPTKQNSLYLSITYIIFSCLFHFTLMPFPAQARQENSLQQEYERLINGIILSKRSKKCNIHIFFVDTKECTCKIIYGITHTSKTKVFILLQNIPNEAYQQDLLSIEHVHNIHILKTRHVFIHKMSIQK